MNAFSATPGRHLISGTIRIFAAEALMVPTGLLTAAFLSRRFGPAGYGLLTLASLIVVLLESNIAMAFSSPAVKLISDAGDHWRPVGTSIVRLYLLAGCTVGLLVWITATPLAGLLHEPALVPYLKLFAFEVPLFCLAQAHRNIIVGLGQFQQRAWASAARWTSRLLFVVVLVSLTGSAMGAIWGTICASASELLLCRIYVRPSLLNSDAVPLSRICRYAMPLVAAILCLSFFQRLDLFLLTLLGGTASDAGVYGVAQNLALLPSLFSFAFAPALLSSLSRLLVDQNENEAEYLGRQALRAVCLLLPLIGMTAGAAPEIIEIIFGSKFSASAPLLRFLIFGSLALLMISITFSIITAAGKGRLTLYIAGPLVAIALFAHIIFIPIGGARAAAAVTMTCACVAAIASLKIVHRRLRLAAPSKTILRTAIVSALAYAFAAFIPAGGILVVIKIAAGILFSVAALYLSGEFSKAETAGLLSLLRGYGRPIAEVPNQAS